MDDPTSFVYRPDRYGTIKGYFSANHRLAAMKALGSTDIRVALNGSHPAAIQRSRLHSWSVSEGGSFQLGTAEMLSTRSSTRLGE